MGTLERLRKQNSVIRAAVYARFSSDNQREESIDAQLRAMNDYAEKNNVVIVSQFIDKAKSATTDNRPEFQRMIKESGTKAFDVVLVHKLDRFARNRQDSIGYRLELKRHGVSLISILEYLDENSPESVILESVLEAMAEYYSLNLAREVNKGLKETALKGQHTGGHPPLGYDVDPATRKLIINDREEPVVQLIFQRTIEGIGYNVIIDELNNKGYLTKVGKPFSKNSLYSILSNEKYMGTFIFNKCSSKDCDGKRNTHKHKHEDEIIRIEDAIPPIISKEDFQAVRSKMKNRKKTSSNRAIETYLLTGKMFCGTCGGAYVGSRRFSGRDKRLHVSYNCNIRYRQRSACCSNKEVRREYIEGYVFEKLSDYVFNENLIPLITKEYNNYLKYQNREVLQQKRHLEKQIASLDRDIENVINLLTKVASDALIAKLNTLENEKAIVTSRLTQIYNTIRDDNVNAEEIASAFRKARTMLQDGSLPFLKKIIELYVQRIVVHPDRVDVYLTFQPSLQIPFEEIQKKEAEERVEMELFASSNDSNDEGVGESPKSADVPLSISSPPKSEKAPRWVFFSIIICI